MGFTVAISGASGKTGFRIAEEVERRGDQARLLLRGQSELPQSLQAFDQRRLDLGDAPALDAALQGVDALVIATGARPSIDLTGPMRVDAWGCNARWRVVYGWVCAGCCWSAPSAPGVGAIPSICLA